MSERAKEGVEQAREGAEAAKEKAQIWLKVLYFRAAAMALYGGKPRAL